MSSILKTEEWNKTKGSQFGWAIRQDEDALSCILRLHLFLRASSRERLAGPCFIYQDWLKGIL